MPVKMAPHQLAFWRELLAPFPTSQLSTTKRGGKELTYVDKRALTNRLDSVVGPHGWFPEYEATSRGYKCRLYITVPTSVEGSEICIHKEDGAGFEEMGSKNKETGEFEYDVDNDEKSGYTNAFRRAAQDAWGIGRYLYGKGIPTFLDPNATAPEPGRSLPPVQSGPNPSIPPAELADRQQPPPSSREVPRDQTPAPAEQQQAPPDDKPNNFRIPSAGASVFHWAMEMEKAFKLNVVDGMSSFAEQQGWGRTLKAWNQVQVNSVCLDAIKHIRELPGYRGEYEHLFPGGVPDPKIPTAQGSGPNTPVAPVGVNLSEIRRELIALMKKLHLKQSGAEGDNASLARTFQAIAPLAATGGGHIGEVPGKLYELEDVVWIKNMIAFVRDQLRAPEQGGAPADCPF